MSNRRLNDNPPNGLTAPPENAGWHKRCAALLGATMLMSLSGPASTPATAQTAACAAVMQLPLSFCKALGQ